MKKFVFIFSLIGAATLAQAQEVAAIVQSVVCASKAEQGNVVVSSVPVIIAEDEKKYYQIGFFTYSPENLPTGIETLSSESKPYPVYNRETDSFIIPAFPAESVISLYSVEGKLLYQIQSNGDSITLNASELSSIVIIHIVDGNNSSSFKLIKSK